MFMKTFSFVVAIGDFTENKYSVIVVKKKQPRRCHFRLQLSARKWYF